MIRAYVPDHSKFLVQTYTCSNPMTRAGRAWEIAEACAYLGAAGADYVTGETLHVAGGSQLWGDYLDHSKSRLLQDLSLGFLCALEISDASTKVSKPPLLAHADQPLWHTR